jgi:hypothetical protein
MSIQRYISQQARNGVSIAQGTSKSSLGASAPGYVWKKHHREGHPTSSWGGVRNPNSGHRLGLYEQVRIKKDREREREPRPDRTPTPPPEHTDRDRRQQQAYDRAQAHLNGETRRGNPPDLFPNGVNRGQGVEGVARFGNQMAEYSGRLSGWMQDRAEADRYQSGRLMERMASWLPKPPDMLSANDMIDMANEMNQRINFRNNRA